MPTRQRAKPKAAAIPEFSLLTVDLYRVVPTIAHAVAVFGDEHKAAHWLRTPLELFNNQSPTQMLTSAAGIKAVDQILGRIEHNILS